MKVKYRAGWPNELHNRYEIVENLAIKNGWVKLVYQENIGMLSFTKLYNKSKARINVYLTKMTIASAINHPKKGKKQLFRWGLSPDEVNKIFKNPRLHTKRGYYETIKTNRPV